MLDQIKLVLGWRATLKWMRRAEAMIRQECDEAVISKWLREFEEFIEHNELECALNMLEEACECFSPSSDVWSLMAEAASSMKLDAQAQMLRERASFAKR